MLRYITMSSGHLNVRQVNCLRRNTNDLDELAEDILVYQDEEHPGWMFGIDVSDDGKYLYLQIFKDTGKVGHVINIMTSINWTTRKTFCGLQKSTTIKSNLGCNGERSSTNILLSIKCKGISFFFCPVPSTLLRITARRSVLYLKTDKDAPRSKVVTIDLSGEEQEIRDFIPEDKDASAQLTHVTSTNKEYFVAIYKRNVTTHPSFRFSPFNQAVVG